MSTLALCLMPYALCLRPYAICLSSNAALAHRLPFPIHDAPEQQTSAHVSIRQRTSAYVSIHLRRSLTACRSPFTTRPCSKRCMWYSSPPASCPHSGVSICPLVLVKLVSKGRMWYWYSSPPACCPYGCFGWKGLEAPQVSVFAL